MNRIALLAAGCAALALAACDHPDAARQRAEAQLKAVSKLDCPAAQGELTRVSAAADGQSCVYSAEGAEVTLRIVPLAGGDAASALAPLETELKALLPPKAPTTPSATSSGPDGEGESVNIHLPGVSIEANDSNARVKVAGGVNIDADDDRAEVRVMRDGEDDTGRRHRDDGVQATFILASDDSTSAWKVAGYEARGPRGGPLVVATVKAKARDHDGHDLFDDMKALIRHNVGGRPRHGAIVID